MCERSTDISAQVDVAGVTIAWRTPSFYLNLMRFSIENERISNHENIISLGRNYFRECVLPRCEKILDHQELNYSSNRYINETLAKLIGLKIVRLPFDVPKYRFLDPIIINSPEPVPPGFNEVLKSFKQRIYVSTQIPGII